MINAVRRTHPGQIGMIRLANLIWFPHIHRTIKLRAENCKQCTDPGKILKPLIPKSHLGTLPSIHEPNRELKIDVPITNESNNDMYILVAVDQYSRYPTPIVHLKCDAHTALNCQQKFFEFRGIPRSMIRSFLKLIFSPTHDHRATGVVLRLLQTLKRRLPLIILDPLWDKTNHAEKISAIIESIRLIPNRVSKTTPCEANFGPNTELSKILTKPNKNNLYYSQIKIFILRPEVATTRNPDGHRHMRPRDEQRGQPQYSVSGPPTHSPGIETGLRCEADSAPFGSLSNRSTIIPSKITFQLGDKKTTIDQTRKNIACNTIKSRVPEPKGTPKLF